MSQSSYILVADDNEPTRELLAGILESDGHSVIKAIDGGSAIKVVNEHKVVLAIVDQYMQPKGGFDFARHLESNEISLPMILMTAHQTSDLLMASREAGFIHVLYKPIEPSLLLKMVDKFLKV